jgi:hypothetical protein
VNTPQLVADPWLIRIVNEQLLEIADETIRGDPRQVAWTLDERDLSPRGVGPHEREADGGGADDSTPARRRHHDW